MAGPQPPTAQSNPPARTGETVTLACKLPHGLILQLQEKVVVKQVFAGEVRDVAVHVHTGTRYVVNGVAAAVARLPNIDLPRISEGFALTHGIPADFWAKWQAENRDNPVLANGTLVAHKAPDAKKAEVSGFEPLNPREMPTEFRNRIATADAA